MSILQKLRAMVQPAAKAGHLTLGERGELLARKFLRRQGMKFLAANYKTPRGELDLVFRDKDCLVFIEVKTRSSEDWERPAAAVDRERRRRLTRAALDYLRAIRNPQIKVRFDIVEVLMNAEQPVIRHLPNSFAMERPYGYVV